MESIFHQRPLQHYPVQASGAFRHLWWLQDGTPAHRLVAVQERLRELFGNRVIALGHNMEWPPRSSDLTPCDFFLWGYMKGKVFTTLPNDLNDLRNRIKQVVETIRNNPQNVREAVQGMLKALCLEQEGGHVKGRDAERSIIAGAAGPILRNFQYCTLDWKKR